MTPNLHMVLLALVSALVFGAETQATNDSFSGIGSGFSDSVSYDSLWESTNRRTSLVFERHLQATIYVLVH